MLKKIALTICIVMLLASALGCSTEKSSTPKIGISFGIGPASRWPQEKTHMEERAHELGIEVISKLNKSGDANTQKQDCKALIDSGVKVLIIMPRNCTDFSDILKYAKEKNVKVIAYARPIIGQSSDLFVGYDTYRIGQTEGLYTTELVRKGNFIVLRGDKGDYNSNNLYKGVMTQLEPAMAEGSNIILDDYVPGWDPEIAKKLVREALLKNNKKIEVILAPNDVIAGACYEVIQELGIKNKVIITGMDAELSAVRRIAHDQQDITFYMSLRDLARTAVEQANNMVTNKKIITNSEFVDNSGNKTPAYLISGRFITKNNLHRSLIEPGIFTREQVFGN